MKKGLFLATAVLGVSGLFVTTASAAPIMQESFDYDAAVGDEIAPVTDYQAIGRNSGGDDDDVTFGEGLTFTGLETAGLSANLDVREGIARATGYDQSFEDVGTVYMSGLFRADKSAGWGNRLLAGTILRTSSNPAVYEGGLTMGIFNDPAGNLVAGLGTANAENMYNHEDFALAPTNLNAGETYYFLAKFEATDTAANEASVSLSVFADGDELPTGEPTAWNAIDGATVGYAWYLANPLDEFWAYQDNAPANSSNYVDEFKAGTAFGDVAVPEPASLGLLGLGGLMLLGRRRRNRC
ncbi:MAG: PEP-CTERM sorting domain-containing protein [Phycisphaeraceae bacterium]